MTKYEFLKLHRPDLLPKMNALCPSDIGLPDSKWRRGSKRCPGCSLATFGCWFNDISDEEIEAAEKFIVDQGMNYRKFVEIHYPDEVDFDDCSFGGKCPKNDYGIECSCQQQKHCDDCWHELMDHKQYSEAIRFLVAHKEEKEKVEDVNVAMKTIVPKLKPDGPVEIINVLKPVDPAVRKPSHYEFSKFSPIKVIRAWGLNFNLGSAVKYIVRAGKKDPTKHVQDLEKAVEYLMSEIEDLRAEQEANN